jgi:hypothetical protein
VRLKLKLALPYIAVVFLFVIGTIAIVTTFLPRNDPPEKQVIDLMKRQLAGRSEAVDLADAAKCANELGSVDDRSYNVDFYRNCVIELDSTSEKLIFRIAFNSRGSIEFWELNRVKQ